MAKVIRYRSPKGRLIGWKKAKKDHREVLVKLAIPASAHVICGGVWGASTSRLVYDTLEYHRPDDSEEIREFERDGYWRVRTKRDWKKMWGSKLVQNICEQCLGVVPRGC